MERNDLHAVPDYDESVVVCEYVFYVIFVPSVFEYVPQEDG